MSSGEHNIWKQQLSAWVTVDVARKVEDRAYRDHVTKSDVVRSAIEMYLDADGSDKGSLARIEVKLDAVLAASREDDPGMAEKIQQGMAERVEDCVSAAEVEW